MNALLFIQDKRKALEKIDLLSLMRVAQSSKKNVEKAMHQWARSADVDLRLED
jgi:hypothetical protein